MAQGTAIWATWVRVAKRASTTQFNSLSKFIILRWCWARKSISITSSSPCMFQDRTSGQRFMCLPTNLIQVGPKSTASRESPLEIDWPMIKIIHLKNREPKNKKPEKCNRSWKLSQVLLVSPCSRASRGACWTTICPNSSRVVQNTRQLSELF